MDARQFLTDEELASRDERAKESGAKRRDNGGGKRSKTVGNGEDISPFSEVALAEQFVERHPNLRYVAAWSKWMLWTGTHWRPDDTLHAFDLARLIAKEAAGTCNKPKTASLIASAETVAAIERLAKADRRLSATVEQWDADPFLLNTPIGVVDLRTGRLRPHRRGCGRWCG